MKQIEVVAGILCADHLGKPTKTRTPGYKIFVTKRGYGEFKGFWEFPGGKVEQGESLEAALIRELKEELSVEVSVDEFVCTVEYDYPNFHLTMHCFFCSILNGNLTLLEHEAMRWLSISELNSVNWLPADIEVLGKIKKTFY